MKSFISEDDIEQAICNRLSQPEYGWTRIECDPSVDAQDDVSLTGRASASECILPKVFSTALRRINPQIDPETLDGIVREYRKDYTGTDMVDTNYKFYNQLRNGIKVKTRNQHREDFESWQQRLPLREPDVDQGPLPLPSPRCAAVCERSARRLH